MKIEIECGGWWRKMAGWSGMRRKLPQKISNGPRSESAQSQIPLNREETQLLNLKLNGGISVLPSGYGSILRSPSERRRYEKRDYRPVTFMGQLPSPANLRLPPPHRRHRPRVLLNPLLKLSRSLSEDCSSPCSCLWLEVAFHLLPRR